MGRWPKPKTPAEAVRRWGKSGTVSIDKTKLELDMRVIMTFERKKNPRADPNMDFTSEFLMMAETNPYQREPIGVRFSGHPEALLAMFRALHIEYAKRRTKAQEETGPRKRTIILDEEKENGNESAPEAQGRSGRNRR